MQKVKAKQPVISPDGESCPGEAISCQYWTVTTKSCSVVQDGLYLPSPEHLATYCTSRFFASCSLYQEFLEQQDKGNVTFQSL
ncbi:hypothetical protein [Desulfogranum marinum]|uniref:hypothetical protein n=1 Tax=Desulfogranum marinum TaxID=453220 RepID=UPI0029C7B501|nr:hypothetical protein [Desulfogranum marinum]